MTADAKPEDTTSAVPRYSRDEWVIDIEFPDGLADDPTSPPVHVFTKPLRINGHPLARPDASVEPGTPRGYGITPDAVVVEALPRADATRVSFEVYADDVEWEIREDVQVGVDDDGDPVRADLRVPVRLFGLRVLSPDRVLWPVSHPGYHAHVAARGKDTPGPTVLDSEPVTCRVVVFARTVAFTQRPGA
jgi:hypothetical protein